MACISAGTSRRGPEDVHALGDADLERQVAQVVLQVAAAGDDRVRVGHALEQQRHGGDQVSLALLRRQSSDVANEEIVRRQRPGSARIRSPSRWSDCVYRRLDAVIDAPHARRDRARRARR